MRKTASRWITRLALVVAVAAVYGCGDDSSSASAPAVVRDSASITIVENSQPAWTAGEGWSLSDEPVTSIGMVDGPAEYQFHDVMGVLVQADGTIVVGDMGTSQLRFFDAAGRHLRTTGQQGSGPGEIRQMMGLGAFRGDTILVPDGGAAVLHVFDSSGEYVDTYSAAAQGKPFHPRPAGYTADGQIIFLLQGLSPQRITEPVRLDFAPALMRLPDETIDTITILQTDPFYPGWRGTPERVLFGPIQQVVAVSDGIIVSTGDDRFELQHIDLDGRITRIIRRTWDPQPVPEELSERYEQMYVGSLGENGNPVPEQLQEQRRQIHAARQVATVLPPFTRVRSDGDDNLWVRETDPEHLVLPQQGWNTFDTVPSLWNIFDPEGIWLGTVQTPANFAIMEIGSDYVAGLTRDDLGVEMVQVYALNK